jgi:acetoin utilization deacetylase AcuC-like enzyme
MRTRSERASLHSAALGQPTDPTLVVRSDAHLGHAGLVELMGGVPVPCFEMPERAVEIERALVADGAFALVEADAFPDAAILAVHDPQLLEVVANAWTDAMAAGDIDGSRPLIPDTFRLAS